MFNKDKFKELAKERDNTDWDCKIDKIWSEMLSMILEDDDSFTEFINYMKTEMTGNEYVNGKSLVTCSVSKMV